MMVEFAGNANHRKGQKNLTRSLLCELSKQPTWEVMYESDVISLKLRIKRSSRKARPILAMIKRWKPTPIFPAKMPPKR